MTLKLITFGLAALCTLIAQDQLPEAPAKKTVLTVCTGCHDLDTVIETRHSKEGWKDTVDKMVDRGATASDQEFSAIVEYLTRYFGLTAINKASTMEIQDGLGISAEQAKAIVEYRTANGNFKDIESLKKVPGIDVKLLDARKDRIVFN